LGQVLEALCRAGHRLQVRFCVVHWWSGGVGHCPVRGVLFGNIW
jgi:hypothetical protein